MRATSAGLLLACVLGTACAQDMTPPHVVVATVDWNAVQGDLADSEALRPVLADAGAAALTELNKAAARVYPSIPQSGSGSASDRRGRTAARAERSGRTQSREQYRTTTCIPDDRPFRL